MNLFSFYFSGVIGLHSQHCMKIQSFIREKNSLVPVEVELTLWPGLPGVQFLGLPDQHLKESSLRIKSAIKAAGFQFPVAQQILVNLRPSHLKKTSRGLELAVAAAYLWESGQVPRPVFGSEFFVYGELTLHGEVVEPGDIQQATEDARFVVLTGINSLDVKLPFRRQVITKLSDLAQPMERGAEKTTIEISRPLEALDQNYSVAQARLLEVLATGEHSALLAGAAGSGKTTIAKSLPGFLHEPSQDQFQQLLKIHSEFGEGLVWRPVVKPHHSTPIMAMVGGGSVPYAGEISRAHGGVLILDELLEFSQQVQEALREPFEEGKMRVLRAGKMKEYPATSQIIATSNLCKCGKWTPTTSAAVKCRFSEVRCRGYSQRLSGPLVDRFDLLSYVEKIGKLEISGKDILGKVDRARKFSIQRYGDWMPNSRRPLHQIFQTIRRDALRSAELDDMESQRRRVATIRVARTLADLEACGEIEPRHIQGALKWTKITYDQLSRWG